MKFFAAVSCLALSLIGATTAAAVGNKAASAPVTNARRRPQNEKKMSAEAFRRILFQLADIDTVEELKEACGLSDERLRALRELQQWLIEYEFDGNVPLFDTFKEKSVWIIFALSGKDPEEDELGFKDFLNIYSLSGISGLSFDEVLDCISSESLSYDELLYIFCLGDPHFATWQGAHFDYHGQCDMVMVHNENFANGKGLDLHIRTEQLMPEGAYSFVSDAALKIGNDVLEVQKDGTHYVNGQTNVDFPISLGGFQVTKSERKNCIQNAEHGEQALSCSLKMLTYDVMLGEDEHIQFKVAKDMVHVEVKGRPNKFEGSVGVMGTYPFKGHGRVARDGVTLMQDIDQFGQEWQVRPLIDGSLFHDMTRVPQYPHQQCIPASNAHASNQRTLRAGTLEEKARSDLAHNVCQHLKDSGHTNMHKNCVFDVMATGDAEMATLVYGGAF